jgi:hypothetical protein
MGEHSDLERLTWMNHLQADYTEPLPALRHRYDTRVIRFQVVWCPALTCY